MTMEWPMTVEGIEGALETLKTGGMRYRGVGCNLVYMSSLASVWWYRAWAIYMRIRQGPILQV